MTNEIADNPKREAVEQAVLPLEARVAELEAVLLRLAPVDARREVSPLRPPMKDQKDREERVTNVSTPTGPMAADHAWDKLARPDFQRDFALLAWGGLARVSENHNQLVTGDASYYWVDWFRDKYLPGGHGGRMLSLGCGEGRIERLFKDHGCTFDSVTGYDISQACVDQANKLGLDMHLAPEIQYHAVDVNRIELAPDSVDFLLFFHSLHHVEALEHVLSQCSRALKPGGVMLVNEFVGPNRFQWTERQVSLAQKILRILPSDLKLDLVTKASVKDRIIRYTVDEMIAMDPTEAVRSAEIERALYETFDVVEDFPWGGTITHLLFENIAGNFSAENPLHDAIVQLIVNHENVLIETGVIPSDFKVYVCRRRA